MERISASLGMINVKEELIYLEGTVLEQTLWEGWENIWLEQKLSLQKEKGREKNLPCLSKMQKDQVPFCLLQRIVFEKKQKEKTLH